VLFQPAIIALLLAAGLGFAALCLSAPSAWALARHWDLRSASDRQLTLERRTYLLSTLMRFILVAQLAALLLFVFNADRMAVQFVGAMCAVGTLQANAYGLPALMAQLLLFFAAALWLVIDHADNQARDYPLVRIKYALLLIVLLPLVSLSLGLQLMYFGNLRADVITSCCGSLFSSDAPTVAGELAGLSPALAMPVWLVVMLLTIIANAAVWFDCRRAIVAALAGLSSALAFVVAIAAIISFLSLYIYEHPHHHCPFCILQAEHGYIGYALYLPLFTASVCGMAVGVLALFRHKPGLHSILPALSRRLAAVATLGFTLFLGLSLSLIHTSNLILMEF
jgi:hypothetical protein